MPGYVDDIERLALNNGAFRRVLYTTHHSQLVVMRIEAGSDIGEEVHDRTDQFLRIEAGKGEVMLDGERRPLQQGSVVVVPAGVRHNVINTSDTMPLKLYTLYSPPHHRDGVVHETKEEALHDEEHFDGRVTEP
jgi:mannose-6-phosphate isomerase-like protein (cupin superfamily)